jgi:hypothetical protein
MTLYVYSLKGDAVEWFLEQDTNKFSTLAEIQKAFWERWGDQKEDRHLLIALSTYKSEKGK